jgi:hypothetical protein
MFEVVKIEGGFAVVDWNGVAVVAYKNRKFADQYALGATKQAFGAAEFDNDRFDAVRSYLAIRAARVAAPVNQLELF